MTEPTNPFRSPQQQQDAAPATDDSTLYPFGGGDGGGGADAPAAGSDLKRVLGQRVQEMNLGGAKRFATQRASQLSVKDLNDLAAEFSGLPTSNASIAQLSLEDLNSLEAVFTEVKIQTAKAARDAAASGAGAPDVNVSCCCCTPCCSCAATETVPFAN
jgi:hypothetical protein